jgi:hypothetical protein
MPMSKVEFATTESDDKAMASRRRARHGLLEILAMVTL